MARDAWLDHLAQVPMFSGLSRKQLQSVAAASVELSVSDGKAFVREGQPGHEAFVIVEGAASVTRGGERIATLGPGAVVGELAPLTGGARNATVTADGNAELLVIGQREFEGLLEEVPDIAVQLLHTLAQRMVELEDRVIG